MDEVTAWHLRCQEEDARRREDRVQQFLEEQPEARLDHAKAAANELESPPTKRLIKTILDLGDLIRESELRHKQSAGRRDFGKRLESWGDTARRLHGAFRNAEAGIEPDLAEVLARAPLPEICSLPGIDAKTLGGLTNALDAAIRLASCGQSNDKMSDVLSLPRGRQVCAQGARALFRGVLGRKSAPRRGKRALQVCDRLWDVASFGQASWDEPGEAVGWERHLREAVKGRNTSGRGTASIIIARLAVADIMKENGYVTIQSF